MTAVLDQEDTSTGSGQAVGDWMPSRYTPSLTGTEEFRTDGDKLLRFAGRHWSIAEAARFLLDAWQVWLIRHVLERYPEDWPVEHLRGQLRYRRVVISMGRQNGKSLIAALFVIYFLCLHVRGPRVLGMASVDRQAKIVYKRVKFAVDKSAALRSVIKTTDTRGLSLKDGTGEYQTLPAKEESAQGEPGTGIIYDELHLGLAALWDAMLLAMKAKRNALLIGITTAGDDNSDLLIRLYAEGEVAIDGQDERMGFFCWEAADPVSGDDYTEADLTEENVIRANPAIACGRVPLDVTMADARAMWRDVKPGPDGLTGRQRAIRYTLNRFINGAADSWTATHQWNASASADPVDHDQAEVVFTVERTAEWEWASITATSRDGEEYRTELVASIADPTPELLLDACDVLARGRRAVFAVDRLTLDNFGRSLAERGHRVWRLTEGEMSSAAKFAHSLIRRRAVRHPGDPLVRVQVARGRRRSNGEGGWRVSRELSATDVDTVIGLVIGLYVAAQADQRDEVPIS